MGNCLRFIMNGHWFLFDVRLILGINTTAPIFDPVMILAWITCSPKWVITSLVPLHMPWLGFTFRNSITSKPSFSFRLWGGIPWNFKEFRNSIGYNCSWSRASVDPLQISSELLYVIDCPWSFLNIFSHYFRTLLSLPVIKRQIERTHPLSIFAKGMWEYVSKTFLDCISQAKSRVLNYIWLS